MISSGAARIGCAVLSFFCAICLLGVSAYAESKTGISVRQGVRDDGDLVDWRPASASDLLGSGDELGDLTGAVVLSPETVVLIQPEASDQLVASSLSEDPSAYGFFVDVTVSGVSSITRIYVPYEYSENSFYIDSGGNLHGLRSGTFTVYSGNYQIRFPSYGSPQYRLISSSTTYWTDTTVHFVGSPNVDVLGARYNFWGDRSRALLLAAVLGVIVCLSLKRS